MSARPSRRLPPYALPAACLLLFAAQVWTFHWGVATYDTLVQYRQVLSGRYEDWHPPVTAFVWRWIGGARLGGAPLLLLDCALYWSGLLLIAEALRRRGRDGAAILVIVIGTLPIPFGQMGALLKDALLAACCLPATGLVAIEPSNARHRLAARLGAILLLMVAGATRFNAVFAVAPLLLLCLLPEFRRRSTAVVPAAMLLALAAPALGALLIDRALQPKRTGPIWSLVNFDLAGTSIRAGRSVYPAGGDPGQAFTQSCYSPRLYAAVDFERCDAEETRLKTFAKRAGLSPLRVWLTGIEQAPLAYLGHRLDHFDRNQRFVVALVPDDAMYLNGEPNDLGIGVRPNHAMKLVHHAATWMAWSPLGRPATWLAAALALLLLVPGGRVPPPAAALAASALLYALAYLVVGVADDLRYNLWTMLAAMLAWVLTIADGRWRTLPPARLRLALTVPAIAVAGELASLPW